MAPERGIGRRDDLTGVLAAYREGIFPMSIPAGPRGRASLAWYEADPRGVIRLEGDGPRLHRRLERTVRCGRFRVTSDRAFGLVIRACGDPRRPGGWIDGEIVGLFEALHAAGLAHSVEAWLDLGEGQGVEPGLVGPEGLLVGGLYGLCVGGVFCAESMFSRPDMGGRDASKVCLARTIAHLRSRGFGLIDTQMWSEHLAQFGCEEVSRREYREMLERWRDVGVRWGEWEGEGRGEMERRRDGEMERRSDAGMK
ncbi:MAG: leucyl/phenylalanyl-tRNA--protein transferase [Phycisphaerales bacterium]|nr:leucyl/phenylalanyl-tRNA--protein transferase [Phycisphaerales bacterium]